MCTKTDIMISVVESCNTSDDCCDSLEEEVSKTIAARNLIYMYYSNKKIDKICQLCGIYKTPLWRKTKDYHTLCNACGIREKTRISKNKCQL